MSGAQDAFQLGSMDSISPECTPLKHSYDRCFNEWFKSYLEASSSATTAYTDSSRSGWTSGLSRLSSENSRIPQQLAQLRDRYENDCGKLFSEYRACVQHAVEVKNLGPAIEKARQENPFPNQHRRQSADL